MNDIRLALLAAAITSIATSASAADFPAGPPIQPYLRAPAAIVAANWGGFYVGGHAGYAWMSGNYTVNNGLFSETFSESGSSGGFIGGGQIGAQAQWGHWVFGIEGTLSGSGTGQTSVSAIAPPSTSSLKVDEIGTFSGRLGWALDRLLFYGKGGLAYGHVRNQYNNSVTTAFFNNDVWKSGYTLGAGVEYMWLPNWTAGVEFDYYNMGIGRSITATTGVTGVIGGDANVYAVMARLNYLFNTWW